MCLDGHTIGCSSLALVAIPGSSSTPCGLCTRVAASLCCGNGRKCDLQRSLLSQLWSRVLSPRSARGIDQRVVVQHCVCARWHRPNTFIRQAPLSVEQKHRARACSCRNCRQGQLPVRGHSRKRKAQCNEHPSTTSERSVEASVRAVRPGVRRSGGGAAVASSRGLRPAAGPYTPTSISTTAVYMYSYALPHYRSSRKLAPGNSGMQLRQVPSLCTVLSTVYCVVEYQVLR